MTSKVPPTRGVAMAKMRFLSSLMNQFKTVIFRKIGERYCKRTLCRKKKRGVRDRRQLLMERKEERRKG